MWIEVISKLTLSSNPTNSGLGYSLSTRASEDRGLLSEDLHSIAGQRPIGEEIVFAAIDILSKKGVDE